MAASERISICAGELLDQIQAKADAWKVSRATAAVWLIADGLKVPRPDVQVGNPNAASQAHEAIAKRWGRRGGKRNRAERKG